MKRPRTATHENAPGQDSFLDVVANLVGILIILVMVVGVRAQDALRRGLPDEQVEQLEQQVAAEQQAAERVEENINHELTAKLKQQQLEVESRRAQRDQMLVVIKAAEHVLEEKRQQLDATGQKAYELNGSLSAAQDELRFLENARRVAENAQAPQTVIEHYPTPLAQYAKWNEIHFRLSAGRLAYVPIDELNALREADKARVAPRLRDNPEVSARVGPIRGFTMQYTYRMQQYTADSGYGATQLQKPVFDHFTLEPESPEVGEPIEVAMRPDSLFRRQLARIDPARMIVTIWVYPDGFTDFRRLRDDLRRQGYLTASRPMPEGVPIGGSPEGSRSVVQ